MRVLGGELAPGAGRHSDNERDRELPAGHMAKGRSGIDDLIERQQAEVHRHDFDNRA